MHCGVSLSFVMVCSVFSYRVFFPLQDSPVSASPFDRVYDMLSPIKPTQTVHSHTYQHQYDDYGGQPLQSPPMFSPRRPRRYVFSTGRILKQHIITFATQSRIPASTCLGLPPSEHQLLSFEMQTGSSESHWCSVYAVSHVLLSWPGPWKVAGSTFL